MQNAMITVAPAATHNLRVLRPKPTKGRLCLAGGAGAVCAGAARGARGAEHRAARTPSGRRRFGITSLDSGG